MVCIIKQEKSPLEEINYHLNVGTWSEFAISTSQTPYYTYRDLLTIKTVIEQAVLALVIHGTGKRNILPDMSF